MKPSHAAPVAVPRSLSTRWARSSSLLPSMRSLIDISAIHKLQERIAPTMLIALIITLLLAPTAWSQYTNKTIYTFTGGPGNGGYLPYYGSLIFDSHGNLYGTAESGGANGVGTVFELTPTAGGPWIETVLYSFTDGNDGGLPYAGLIFDSSGNLYGTTYSGGAYGSGVVFELTPTASGPWTETVLYTFTGGSDGGSPATGVIFDSFGNLYGTTYSGGANGDGVVFRLTPTASAPWNETVLFAFCGPVCALPLASDGAQPFAGGLIFDHSGNLYGTTVGGGGTNNGVVFELTPTASGPWNETVLHSFSPADGDGGAPYSGVIFDHSGNLYGTTFDGGANEVGTVFELTPTASGPWNEIVLHAFTAGSDGGQPYAGVIFDSAGNLYGTTYQGGDVSSGNVGSGVVFELTPTASGTWNETVLYNFTGGNDGGEPHAGVTFDSSGNLYGTTYCCGASHEGVAFELIAPAASTQTSINSPTITYGANGGVTVTVTSNSGAVTGNVSLTVDSGPPQAMALDNGMATFTIPTPAGGSHSLSASYAAQGNFAASAATGTLQVSQATPTVAFTGAPASATYQATFTVAATTNASTTAVITASGACSTVGATVTITATSGTCSLLANWAADNNFFAASATQSTIVSAPYSVTGIAAPVAYYSAGSLGFVGVAPGQTVTQSLTLANVGLQPLAISGEQITQDASNSFLVTQVQCSDGTTSITDTLPSGGECTLAISYTAPASGPPTSGTPSGTIAFTDNAGLSNLTSTTSGSSFTQSLPLSTTVSTTVGPPDPPTTITLSITETITVTDTPSVTEPVLTLSRSSLTFANQIVGTPSPGQAATLTNTGTGAMTFSGFTLAGANATDFALTNTCGGTLAANTGCTIFVTFTPAAAGARTAQLSVTDNAGGSPQTILLSGTGTLATTATSVTSSVNPSVFNQAVSFTATVSSTTGTPSGTVTFYDGGTTIGTAGLVNGTSTFLGTLSVGSHSITASYGGDSGHSVSTSSVLVQTVNKATPTVSFTGAPASAPYQATFTVVATTNASTTAVIKASGACSIAGAIATISAPSGTCSLSATWAADTNYLAASATQSTMATMATPTISWTTPAAITYGTALSGTQLDATATYNGATVAGTFVYTPAKSIVLTAGTQTLSVTFTPTKTADYNTASASVTLQVNQATPKITWAKPAAITYGTPLSSTQLDASSSVPGTFAYSSAAGTVLSAGTQTLSVTFTPTDTTDYTTATDSVTIKVNTVTPTVTWATPAAITYGTALSGTQLDATASVPGSFAYSPAAGAIEGGGSDTLSVTFSPTDTIDYTKVTASVTLQVNPATLIINWTTPAAITYGTALSGTQLDATATYNGATVAGTFVYTPAKSIVLTAGTQTLSVTFTPTKTADYNTASASVTLQVNQATPKITWAKPAAITYGTPLSGTQLDASSSVPGTFAYSPVAGTVLSAGTQTLSVTFTPTDTTDYTTATDSVTITVK
jgi:uncharacterized repeat protein (TIGR03803 family)